MSLTINQRRTTPSLEMVPFFEEKKDIRLMEECLEDAHQLFDRSFIMTDDLRSKSVDLAIAFFQYRVGIKANVPR